MIGHGNGGGRRRAKTGVEGIGTAAVSSNMTPKHID